MNQQGKQRFKKRRKGLMKKVRELSVLCDVKVCALVYAPNESQPVDVWPSEPEAMRLVQRFKSIPEMEKSKKMMNQESFLRQRITKLQEQLQKQEKDNREMETSVFLYRALGAGGSVLQCMNVQDVTSLAWLVEMKIKAVQERLDLLLTKARMPLKVEQQEVEKVVVTGTTTESAPAPAPAPAPAMGLNLEEFQAQDWFMRAMMGNQYHPPPSANAPPPPPHPHPHHQDQGNVNMTSNFMGDLGLNLMQMQQPYVNDHYGDSFLDSLFSH
ncbi:agamous-like MADS-box protein AGL80 [Dioscorea cayenensis subsp. rotundata]|uniref:Agamous-like MADS-box protein AGL80 n=1 Tax=Dioscorea cayennensis subsp. rotundata TaxID=55577 RepID=A0AB40CJW4_DIOCR|nr:agamous-like MADS-box protein AGL80 [Dioscorea cayenensis subsp. rotundata]